jgi:hypothetical protein
MNIGYLLCILLFSISLGILIFYITKDYYIQKKYKGLCLFDIDGTLTTGQNNEQTVDICLKNGWAVGISTAGAMYDPTNLLSFPWMPKNLYNFMAKHQWTTFNNVARNIYGGKFKQPPNHDEAGHKKWGILKGYSLMESAKALNIKPNYNNFNSNLILFDNDPSFIEGTKMFPHIKAVCAGSPCSQDIILTPNLVVTTLKPHQ